MTHQVKDEDGQIHEFPDEATPAQMQAAMQSISKPKKYENFGEDVKGIGHELQNLAGGAAGTIQKAAAGLGQAGQYIGDTVANKLYKDFTGKDLNIPKVNVREQMGLEGDNQVDLNKIISHDPNSVSSQIGSIAPYLFGGTSGVGATAAGGGAMAGLTASPDEKLISSHLPIVGQYMPQGQLPTAIESTLLGMLAPTALKQVGKGLVGVKNIAGDVKEGLQYGKKASNLETELTNNIDQAKENAANQQRLIKQSTDSQVEDLNNNAVKTSQELSQSLAGQAKTMPEVSESISNTVRDLHDQREAAANTFLNYVKDEVKNTPDGGLLYKKPDPLISMALDESKPLMSTVKDLNVGKSFDQFEHNPTFENAHLLQQQLGVMIGDLKSFPMRTAEERIQFGKLNNAYEQISKDMENYLSTKFPDKNIDLVGKWKQGKQLYEDTVVPYLSNEKLREITRGRKRYVKDIHEAFADPRASDVITREGETQIGAGSKLLNDLPQETKNQILFSKIGANPGKNPNEFINKVEDAKVNGFQDYAHPGLNEGINHILTQQQKAEKIAKYGKEHESELRDNVKRQVYQMKKEAKPAITAMKEKSRFVKKVGSRMLGDSLAAMIFKGTL